MNWIKFVEYAQKHTDLLVKCLLEHIQLVGTALLISLLIAIPVSLILLRLKKISQVVMALLGALYSIPSLAFFSLLLPFLGLGKKNAIFVLVVYSQFILVRNILAGFHQLDKNIIEAGIGMGMTKFTIFTSVQLPLVLPVLIGGIRIAAIVTIGSATIAQTVNAGGLGKVLFDGLSSMNYIKMIWGTVYTAGLALVVNWVLSRLEIYSLKRAEGRLGNAG